MALADLAPGAQLIFQPMAPSHILQIFLRVTIQNQIRIAQRVIVDEIVQF